MNKHICHIVIFFTFIVCILPVSIYAKEPSIEILKEPQITRKVLDNGMTVLVKEVHTFPIVSIEARFKIGSANEGEFLGSGISHFVEHMLFKGTPARGPGDIEREIKSYGGSIGGFTSFDSTGYRLTVRSEYFKEALALLADALMNPEFREEEFKKERDVILKEIKLGRDDPARRISQLLWSTAYTTHPYRHPIIGYEELFSQLSREDLISYHKKNYITNNLVLSICGDIHKAVALEEVEEVFKNNEKQMYVLNMLPEEPQQIARRESKERISVNLSRLLIGYPSVPIGHEDLFALDVLASVLGQGQSSILHRRLVEKERIAYSAGLYNYTPKDRGLFLVSAVLDEENIPRVQEIITEELEKIKNGQIDKAQLEKAQNSNLTSYILNHETIQAQASDLVEGEILVGNPKFSKDYLDGIKKVNAKGIIRVANLYLKGNTQNAVLLLPKLTEEEKVPQEPHSKDEIILNKFELPNGIRVITREDRSLPVVTMRVVFKGGSRLEDANNNGISNITSDMLLKGTKKNSKDDIHGSIERMGGGISGFSGNNSFGIGLTILSDKLDFGLELLSDIIKNSTFPEGEFDKTRELVLAAIKNREDDIFESGIKLFKENLFTDHPYRFTIMGEKESVERIERKDILEFYRELCAPSNTVLAIFGDIDTQKTLAKADKFFKDLKGEMPERLLEETPRLKIEPTPDKKIMDKEQVLIISGFKTVRITDPDIYPFSVLGSILSGSDGRFFHNIRDKLGISYTQGVLSVPGLDRGYFLFYIATSKEYLEVAKELITDEIRRLKEEPVTDEELELAKASLMGAQIRRLQSNSNLAFEASLDELYGLGYENFKKFDSRIAAVTKEDIKEIVNRYFDLGNLTTVTLGPLDDIITHEE